MNKSTSQIQQKEENISGVAQSPSETRQQETLACQPYNNSYEKQNVSNYTPDSLWTNFRYGLGMLLVIVIPPLIPGASVRLLIMGYMGVIVGIYTVAAIVTAMRVLRPTKAAKRGRNRMYYR